MKPPLHLVKLRASPILNQLQWEEALLRADENNWCVINRGSPPAIVMGISGKIEKLINQNEIRKNPIPIIRRFSGGGTVVIDENTLFITLICRSDALSLPLFPRQIMQWTADALYQPLFKEGAFSLKESDYTLNEKKWGGNAQAIIRNRWLHHSSLLWDYCPKRMNYLLIPPKMPAYRRMRLHCDFLCRLKDFWAHPDHFQEQLIQQLHMHFDIIETNTSTLTEIATRAHRKETHLC